MYILFIMLKKNLILSFIFFSELRIMIADSSSRLQRGGTGGSLATALRDRGSCVIPVQPNRSLPIRPAPPTPTRSAASLVTSRSPILKLSKSQTSNLVDIVEVQSDISSSMLTDNRNEFSPFEQQAGNGMMFTINRSGYILPRIPTTAIQVSKQTWRLSYFFNFFSLSEAD